MDPAQGQKFIDNMSQNMDFRKAFNDYNLSTTATLVRLGAPEPKPPMFFLSKLEKVREALVREEKCLANSWLELEAREQRVEYLRGILDQGCDADWDQLVGFKSQIPGPEPQPPM